MIILASQSPRRHELMKLTGLPFTVRVADIDETMDPALPVQQEVTRVSRRKAQAIAAGASPDDIVIAADTIVVIDGRAGKAALGGRSARYAPPALRQDARGRDRSVRLERLTA